MVTGKFISIADVDRCACGHLKHFHISQGVEDVCRWCAKMELRHPQFNFTPRHKFMRQGPITVEIATVIAEQLRTGKPGWMNFGDYE